MATVPLMARCGFCCVGGNSVGGGWVDVEVGNGNDGGVGGGSSGSARAPAALASCGDNGVGMRGMETI